MSDFLSNAIAFIAGFAVWLMSLAGIVIALGIVNDLPVIVFVGFVMTAIISGSQTIANNELLDEIDRLKEDT